MPEPPPLHFDHIGIVVADLAQGRHHLTQTLALTRWTVPFDDPGLGVSVQFGTDHNGGPTLELIAPLGDSSPVANALSKGQRILSHVAYCTPDLAASAAHLIAEGCTPTAPGHPAVAYNGQRVQFFISPLRFVIELIECPAVPGQPPGHQHAFFDPEPETAA